MRPYIIPFAAYVLLTLAFSSLGLDPAIGQAAKLLILAGLIFYYRKSYKLKPGLEPFGVLAGVLIFLLWFGLDKLTPWFLGQPSTIPTDPLYLGLRLLNSVLIAPIIEEFFTRFFLNRYVQSQKWEAVPIYRFSATSFIVTVLFFGLSHNRWVAGIITGIILNLLLIKTKRIESCVMAHATANLLLGVFVIATQSYTYWG